MSQVGFILNLPPVPCSRARVTHNGTYYPESYRDWLKDAEDEIRRLWHKKTTLQRIGKLSTQFYGWHRRADITNLLKAVEDACVNAEVLRDDNLTVIDHTEAAWEKAEAKDEQRIEVFIDL